MASRHTPKPPPVRISAADADDNIVEHDSATQHRIAMRKQMRLALLHDVGIHAGAPCQPGFCAGERAIVGIPFVPVAHCIFIQDGI